jgi:hypothetical protein
MRLYSTYGLRGDGAKQLVGQINGLQSSNFNLVKK